MASAPAKPRARARPASGSAARSTSSRHRRPARARCRRDPPCAGWPGDRDPRARARPPPAVRSSTRTRPPNPASRAHARDSSRAQASTAATRGTAAGRRCSSPARWATPAASRTPRATAARVRKRCACQRGRRVRHQLTAQGMCGVPRSARSQCGLAARRQRGAMRPHEPRMRGPRSGRRRRPGTWLGGGLDSGGAHLVRATQLPRARHAIAASEMRSVQRAGGTTASGETAASVRPAISARRQNDGSR